MNPNWTNTIHLQRIGHVLLKTLEFWNIFEDWPFRKSLHFPLFKKSSERLKSLLSFRNIFFVDATFFRKKILFELFITLPTRSANVERRKKLSRVIFKMENPIFFLEFHHCFLTGIPNFINHSSCFRIILWKRYFNFVEKLRTGVMLKNI